MIKVVISGIILVLASIWGGFYVCEYAKVWEMAWIEMPTIITCIFTGLTGVMMTAAGLGIK